jgi:sulfur carrier protein ThiS
VKITVKLIGGLVHTVGFAEQEIHLPAGTTAGALLAGLGIDRPGQVITTRNVISPPFSGG